jgi:hypothetical protein
MGGGPLRGGSPGKKAVGFAGHRSRTANRFCTIFWLFQPKAFSLAREPYELEGPVKDSDFDDTDYDWPSTRRLGLAKPQLTELLCAAIGHAAFAQLEWPILVRA